MRDTTVRLLSRLHALAYRASGGLLGRRLADNDMLLLTTVGRKTGRPHTVPLLFLRDGERMVVIASYGGRPHHPEWYLNLVAEPGVKLQLGSTIRAAMARPATATERAKWWDRVVAAYDGYAAYQARTERQIPIVFLDPAP